MVEEHGHGNLPGEREVLDDIRYFETCVASLEENGRRNAADLQVYRLLLRQRRQLLAAIRDGVPEHWREYAQLEDRG